MLDPKSPQAEAITNLFLVTMGIALLILLLVTVLVVTASIRFRHRPGADEPEPVHGKFRLEVGWTVGPLLIVGFLFGLVLYTVRYADPASGETQPELIIKGHQWWWEVRYPQAGVVTANEIHIPAGRSVLVQFDSADVIHSFWVPQLDRKMDLTPGHPTSLYMHADDPGTYSGACAEYCGTEHSWMQISVIAQTQADYDAWLANERRPVPPPAGGSEAAGRQVYQEKTCVNCHAIGGQGGQAGPDLSHLGGRGTIGAGILTNTPTNLAKWLADPQSVKPGIYMPNVKLTTRQVSDLVAYLESLK